MRPRIGLLTHCSAGTPPGLPPLGAITSFAKAINHRLPQQPHTARRHHSGGGGGGVSLADLAKVFQQLGSESPGCTQQVELGRGDAAVSVTAAAPAASSLDTPHGTDCNGFAKALRDSSGSSSHQGYPSNRTGATTRGESVSRDPPHKPSKQPRKESAVRHPLISLSPAYAARLATLTEAQLCTELEKQLGRLDHSNIMQCLHEVVRRLSPDPLNTASSPERTTDCDDSTASDAKRRRYSTGAEDVVSSSPAHTHAANHRLLTAVLSALHRMDVYVMEAETEWSPPSASPHTQQQQQQQQHHHDDGKSLRETPFSARLCRVLLQWLSREVSCMTATVSLQVLHLLAQQRLMHMDAVLETLVDTIIVHVERRGPAAAAAAATRPQTTDRAFTVEDYSLLLDTLARYQAQLLRLSYLRQSTNQERDPLNNCALRRSNDCSLSTEGTAADEAGMTDYAIDPCLASATAEVRRRALDRSRHPVANGRLFHHLAESLALTLTNSQRRCLAESTTCGAATHPVDTADASAARLLKTNSTSLRFLIRALSKLQWWHDGLAAALAAPLTGYVRAHPESALVVVGLVGRRENRSGDASLLEALQDSLITQLRRRRRALTLRAGRAPIPRQGRATRVEHSASVENDACGIRRGEEVQHGGGGAQPYWSSTAIGAVKKAESPSKANFMEGDDHRGEDWEEGGEADMPLLSTLYYTTPEPTHSGSRALLATATATTSVMPSVVLATQCGAAPPSPQKKFAPDSAASLTLIDLHALPGTLEALCRFHVRTIAGTIKSDARARLVRKMCELLSLVFDDTLRGITSLDAIPRDLTPALLSRVLLTLLEATEQLNQVWRTTNEPDASTHSSEYVSTDMPHSPHHPLVIELAYAWILQVMQSRSPPRPPPSSSSSSQLDESTAAEAAQFHRIAASAYWRRAVAVHDALVRADILRCTRPCSSDAAAALHRKYYMPHDVLRAAPRVNEAVQRCKTRIEAERRRAAAAEKGDVEQHEQQHQAVPWRYASAAIRDAARQRRQQRQQHSSSSSSSPSPHHPHRCTTTVRPVQTSDVFAGYSKSLSRLL
ncbi:hypothetical protein JKF63_07758 [Porcisia hertigi]|uniref:Uncharacterized protein n=1 Tax=Porcisia hertigi TaxID=2761500 RepID=A0A836LLU4_9TRYP|nr:hypothetical protein JKF63_07758 [Porcisia hertigi]